MSTYAIYAINAKPIQIGALTTAQWDGFIQEHIQLVMFVLLGFK